MNDLGHVDKIIVGKDSSVLIKDADISETTLNRIEELKEQQQNMTIKSDKDFINERVASLAGAIGCIYVGANSDVEQKEKFDRVDDSVCAVRSALQEGIIPGGGLALFHCARFLREYIKSYKPFENEPNIQVAGEILAQAIQVPLKQIIINAGKDVTEIISKFQHMGGNIGYDVKNEDVDDMYVLGVIDPLKVTKNALVNAVSVATTILSTNAIITHKRA